MKVVTHYDEAEWLKWRRGGISASDAPIIAGEVKQPSRVDLWLDKRGKGVPVEANEAMRFGKAMEPIIAKLYGDRTGDHICTTQICAEADDTPFPMRATLDAETVGGRILEFKAVGVGAARYWPEDGDAENIPARVLYQVQHQMRVAGRDSITVVAAIPLELRLYEVQRHENIIEALMMLERDFWNAVEAGRWPSMNDEDAEAAIRYFGTNDRTIRLGHDVANVVDSYEEVSSSLRELEADKKRLKDCILSAMSSHRYALLPDGRRIDCNVIQVAERTQTVKAHSQVRLTVKRAE